MLGSIVEIAQGPPALVNSNAPYVAAASVVAISLGKIAVPVVTLFKSVSPNTLIVPWSRLPPHVKLFSPEKATLNILATDVWFSSVSK